MRSKTKSHFDAFIDDKQSFLRIKKNWREKLNEIFLFLFVTLKIFIQFYNFVSIFYVKKLLRFTEKRV